LRNGQCLVAQELRERNFVECLLNNSSPLLVRFLLQEISSDVNNVTWIDFYDAMKVNGCFASFDLSLTFRQHFQYALLSPECADECPDPICEDPLCMLPDTCTSRLYDHCLRDFLPQPPTPVDCSDVSENFTCAWIEGDQQLEISGYLDEQSCTSAGVCVVNGEVFLGAVTPEECDNQGWCDQPCPGASCASMIPGVFLCFSSQNETECTGNWTAEGCLYDLSDEDCQANNYSLIVSGFLFPFFSGDFP
jgi:hypothetical protein